MHREDKTEVRRNLRLLRVVSTTILLAALPLRSAGAVEPQITAIAAAGSHSLVLDASGAVWAWGGNGDGQLGDGTTANRPSPVPVSSLGPGSGVVAIAAGGGHSLALRFDGTVLAWGLNASGQLGDTTTSNRLTPVPVWGLPGSPVVAIAAGGTHSLALPADGTVLAWGSNTSGQLGDGTDPVVRVPDRVKFP